MRLRGKCNLVLIPAQIGNPGRRNRTVRTGDGYIVEPEAPRTAGIEVNRFVERNGNRLKHI